VIAPDFRDRLTPEQRAIVRAIQLEHGPCGLEDLVAALGRITALFALARDMGQAREERATATAVCALVTLLDLAQDRERFPGVGP